MILYQYSNEICDKSWHLNTTVPNSIMSVPFAYLMCLFLCIYETCIIKGMLFPITVREYFSNAPKIMVKLN